MFEFLGLSLRMYPGTIQRRLIFSLIKSVSIPKLMTGGEGQNVYQQVSWKLALQHNFPFQSPSSSLKVTSDYYKLLVLSNAH